jgi:hypothetical protein
MFRLFLRARAHNLRDRLVEKREFRARSADRDAKTDRARLQSVMTAIATALQSAQSEHSGLNQRVEDVLARAAVTFGNGTDEYLERDPVDSHHQDLFTIEISNGQRRLQELASTIGHLKFLRAAMASRFPDYKDRTTSG